MSKARGLADLGNVYDDGALSNRNLIINGAMQVAQRGTNINVTGGRLYGLDRWCSVGANTAETMSMQQVQNTSYNLDFTHYMKHTKSTTDGCWIYQRLEDVKRFSGKTLTLSYYAWVDSGSTTVTSGSWGRFNGVDENVSGYGGNTITVTPTPTKFVHTFTFADILSTAGSSSDFFELNWYRNTASNLNLANVQLEVGDTATPFEHRSYGQELALAQRFYQKSNKDGYYQLPSSSGGQIQRQYLRFSPTMRTAPTMTTTKTGGSAATAVGVDGSERDGLWFSFGGNQYDVIYWDWTADAEL